ncbi:shikimate dehydrogenase [Oscillospiraceae bacterium PP1C4]
MEQYRLIGYPLGHSLSPQIHQKLFELEGCPACYELFSFASDQLEAHISALKQLNGFNVTIPYKRMIMPFLDELEESAQLYGAVNTVHNLNGRYIGYNTDCDGFLHTMLSHGISLDTRVCILGAGGVGRMFAIECARQGAEVVLAVRSGSLEKAQALAAEILVKTGMTVTVQDTESLDGSFGLVINATPVGMSPNIDASPVSSSFLENVDAVFDCIYNPAETLLLRDARRLGKQTAGGMDMLVWQAAAAHEIWNGSKFDGDDITKIIEQMNAYLLQKERQA